MLTSGSLFSMEGKQKMIKTVQVDEIKLDFEPPINNQKVTISKTNSATQFDFDPPIGAGDECTLIFSKT